MNRTGFTLVELLVGVSVMVGVMSAAYFCMSAGYRSREAIERHSDLLQRGRTAIEIIARDLRHASPTGPDLRFTGLSREKDGTQADNLDFVTHYWTPTHNDQGDLCEVSYFVDRDPKTSGQLNLYRRRDPTPDFEPFAGGTREVIARDIAGFRLEYYDGFDWVDEWRDDDDEREEKLAAEEPPEEPELDEEGNARPEPDPYVPGQSGLPEAVRLTIAFGDRKSQPNALAERAMEVSSPEAEISDSSSTTRDPAGVIVVQVVVKIMLTHRERSFEEGEMGPGLFDNLDSTDEAGFEFDSGGLDR